MGKLRPHYWHCYLFRVFMWKTIPQPWFRRRRVHLGRAARRDLGQRLLTDRGHVGERARRRDPLAADPVPGVNRYAGNLAA